MPLDRTSEFVDAIPDEPSIVVEPPGESPLATALSECASLRAEIVSFPQLPPGMNDI